MDLKEVAKLLVRAIEGGAFDDLAVAYRSDQCSAREFAAASAEKASAIVGEDLSIAGGEIGLAAYWASRGGSFPSGEDPVRWMTDKLTWAKARRS